MNHSVHIPGGNRLGAVLTRWRERVALSDAAIAVGRWISTAVYVIESRRARPWLAMVAVPLASNAALMALLWWTSPPLIVCVWWWADRSWTRTWLLPIEYSCVGTAWCLAGSSALAVFTSDTILVGAIWAASALVLALVALSTRRFEEATWGHAWTGH